MKKQLLILTFLGSAFVNQAQIVSTFVGTGSQGNLDGTGTAASFFNPTGICINTAGTFYVADLNNHEIREISPLGVVSTLAGNGLQGTNDGTGSSAFFNYPSGVCVDNLGNIYVADQTNNLIRKITPLGVVTTIAGTGTAGSADGIGIAASFNAPTGICADLSGNLYVTDFGNNTIRQINTSGVVVTISGTGIAGAVDGIGTNASFNGPTGICCDPIGNLYVTDFYNHSIRKISPTAVVSTLAGSITPGSSDGTGASASFFNPYGICVDPSYNLFVADYGNHKIRKVTGAGIVTTVAGSGLSGSTDATGISAEFYNPTGVCVDASGDLFVADYNNQKIRKITMMASISENQFAENQFQISPNPTNSFITIKATSNVESIKIFDLLGSLVQTETNNSFSVEQLPNGIYVIQIKTTNGLSTARFSKE